MIPDLLILFLSLVLISLLSILLVCIFITRKLREQCERIVSGKLESLTDKECRYRKKYPNASDEETLNRVIRSECRVAGYLGFLTGLGGLVTLPVTLPIDILTSIKSQRGLVEYIFETQGVGQRALDKAKTLALIFGTRQASQMGVKFAVSLAVKNAPQILFKAVPIVGGVIGFVTSYLSTQSVAKYAKRTFSRYRSSC